jgi:hypothetical protein
MEALKRKSDYQGFPAIGRRKFLFFQVLRDGAAIDLACTE